MNENLKHRFLTIKIICKLIKIIYKQGEHNVEINIVYRMS